MGLSCYLQLGLEAHYVKLLSSMSLQVSCLGHFQRRLQVVIWYSFSFLLFVAAAFARIARKEIL